MTARRLTTSRVCSCRAQKLKCIYATTDDSPDPPSCQRCQAHDLECRFDLAWRKRGPPPRDERARRDEQDLTELRNAVAQLADKDGESLAQLQASLSTFSPAPPLPLKSAPWS